jgi:hypothetical protein
LFVIRSTESFSIFIFKTKSRKVGYNCLSFSFHQFRKKVELVNINKRESFFSNGFLDLVQPSLYVERTNVTPKEFEQSVSTRICSKVKSRQLHFLAAAALFLFLNRFQKKVQFFWLKNFRVHFCFCFFWIATQKNIDLNKEISSEKVFHKKPNCSRTDEI